MIKLFLLFCGFLLFQIMPLSAALQASGKLILTGSSTMAPLISEMGKRFERKNKGARIDVQSGGSSRGIADVRQGLADIGMVSRSLKSNEDDLMGFPVALDGVAVILHQSNPVSVLSDEQVIDIYTGKITDWSQVGGKNAPITVVNKAEGRSTLEVFMHYYQINNKKIKAHVIIGDNQQGIKTVAGNPNAIGYVSIGSAEYDSTHGIPIKLLPVGGVAASAENVRSGRFPLSRQLNLVTQSAPTGLAKAFIDFAQSPDAYDIIRQLNFVPIEK